MTQESPDPTVDGRPSYVAPRALRVAEKQPGMGDCSDPGSGDADMCTKPGNSAGYECLNPGSTAAEYCEDTGSAAALWCYEGVGGDTKKKATK